MFCLDQKTTYCAACYQSYHEKCVEINLEEINQPNNFLKGNSAYKE